jgi:hypothetical protein
MFKSRFKAAALLGSAATLAYATLYGTEAFGGMAFHTIYVIAPNQACVRYPVACLQQHAVELREIAKKASDQAFDLMFEQDQRNAELKEAAAAVAANTELLNSGRDAYARCAKDGLNIQWKGRMYSSLAELKAQLQFLYEDEKPILDAAFERQRQYAQQSEDNIRENAKLRARVDAELRLMPARIDAERHKVLRADFDRLVASIDQFSVVANQQIKATSQALKLRTTQELTESEPVNTAPVVSVTPRPRNPDFENFLAGGKK